jgi:hypothetical protein
MLLALECYFLLIRIDLRMRFGGLPVICKVVRNSHSRNSKDCTVTTVPDLCHAIDLACVLYFKPVFCLQRSAATALLLRSFGYQAEMVIGAQMVPFRSHAWVETQGAVVNDKPYMLEIYQVLERC